MPFELEVFLARSKAYVPVAGSGQGEKDIVGAIEDCTTLLRQCRLRGRKAAKAVKAAGGDAASSTATLSGGVSHEVWNDRATRVGIAIAGLMVEMKVSCRVFPPPTNVAERVETGLCRRHRTPSTSRRR